MAEEEKDDSGRKKDDSVEKKDNSGEKRDDSGEGRYDRAEHTKNASTETWDKHSGRQDPTHNKARDTGFFIYSLRTIKRSFI